MAISKKTDSNVLVRRWRNWNTDPVSGNVKDAAILEDNLAISQMVKHEASIWLRNFNPQDIYKKNEIIFMQKLIHKCL